MKQYLEADNPPSGPCDLRKPNSIKLLSHPAARRNLDALVATKLIQVKTQQNHSVRVWIIGRWQIARK